jgi:hypothetical protein
VRDGAPRQDAARAASPQRAALLRLLAALPVAAAAPAWAAAAESEAAREARQLTDTARLLAGLPPLSTSGPAEAVTRQPAWQKHSRASSAGAAKLNGRLKAMDGWRRDALGDTPLGGRTLVYPFSGPDFVNAYALFPGYDNYVFFSLEEPGRVPQLAGLGNDALDRLLTDLRDGLNDLVHLNFFITPNMKEQLRASSLRGVAPVLLAMMALMDLTVLRLRPVDLWPERTRENAGLTRGKRPALPLRAVQIDFERPGGPVQTLWYFSLDVSDAQLAHTPEFIAWLRDFREPVVLLKSASYLLHGEHFTQVRNFIRERAVQVVQDDTGMPFRLLQQDGWTLQLYGRYEQPVALFKHRYQPDLAQAFMQSAGNQPVPFPFGYNWRKGGNSFVIVARRARLTS